MYTYIYEHIHMYIYIYTDVICMHIYIEGERKRHIYIHIYVWIYIGENNTRVYIHACGVYIAGLPRSNTTQPRTGGKIRKRHEEPVLIRNMTEPCIADTPQIIVKTRSTRPLRLTRLTRLRQFYSSPHPNHLCGMIF